MRVVDCVLVEGDCCSGSDDDDDDDDVLDDAKNCDVVFWDTDWIGEEWMVVNALADGRANIVASAHVVIIMVIDAEERTADAMAKLETLRDQRAGWGKEIWSC